VNGLVDEKLRALIRVPVSASKEGERHEIAVWIDTAFNGGLVIPKSRIEQLGLIQESAAEAVLANGQLVQLETYQCFLNWFGETYETQIVANDSEFPLLGTMLLDGRRLEVDYQSKTVEIN
jgi:clan AA aspartic protease